MTHDVQFVCVVCDGLEICPPGAEPPSPPVCHTCDRLTTADLVTTFLGEQSAAELLDAVADAAPACRTADADLFTGPDAFDVEAKAARRRRELRAKRVCRSCPAVEACLAYALAVRPKEGVWAGRTADEITNLAYGLTGFERVAPMGEVA